MLWRTGTHMVRLLAAWDLQCNSRANSAAHGMRRSRLPSLFKYMPKGDVISEAKVQAAVQEPVASAPSMVAEMALSDLLTAQAIPGPSRLPDMAEALDESSVVLAEPTQKSRKGKERADPKPRVRRKAPTLFDMAEEAAKRGEAIAASAPSSESGELCCPA